MSADQDLVVVATPPNPQPAGAVDVRDHGATGDGSTVDTAAFTAAIAAAGEGGTVWIPDGTYIVNNVQPLEGQTLIGQSTAAVAKKDPIDGNAVITCVAPNVIIDGLGVDLVSPVNFAIGIYLNTAACIVRRCRIFDSRLLRSGPGWTGNGGPPFTVHAILARDGAHVIEDNETDRSQIKAIGSGYVIQRNVCRGSANFAISAVLESDGETVSSVEILNNTILDPANQGGIYAGSDINNAPTGEYRNLTIRGNTIVGSWAREVPANTGCSQIVARPCRVSVGWTIEDNTIVCTDPNPPSNSNGIVMDCIGSSLTDAVIRNNSCSGVDFYGLLLQSKLENVTVQSNKFGPDRGTLITARGDGPSTVTLLDNETSKIVLNAFEQDLTATLLRNAFSSIDKINTAGTVTCIGQGA